MDGGWLIQMDEVENSPQFDHPVQADRHLAEAIYGQGGLQTTALDPGDHPAGGGDGRRGEGQGGGCAV